MTQGQFAYFQGNIVPIDEAKVSVMTNAFNYGTAVFGGMRAYWNADEEQLYLVRPRDHFRRLLQSSGFLHADLDHTPDSLTEILRELLRREGYRTNVYIRPLIYAASERIGVHFQGLEYDLASSRSLPAVISRTKRGRTFASLPGTAFRTMPSPRAARSPAPT